MSKLVRLYPRDWRDRYETEFLSVLEARPPSTSDRLDIVRGAIDARLHRGFAGSSDRPQPTMQPARLAGATAAVAGLGFLAWTGLVLREFRGWGAGMPESAGVMVVLSTVTFLALAAAHLALAVAVGSNMRAVGTFAAAAAAVCFTLTGLGGGWTLVFALVASGVLAAAMACRSISRWLAAIWIGSSVLTLAVMLRFVEGGGQDVGLLAGAIPLGLSWILVAAVVTVRGLPSPAVHAADTTL